MYMIHNIYYTSPTYRLPKQLMHDSLFCSSSLLLKLAMVAGTLEFELTYDHVNDVCRYTINHSFYPSTPP